jgi:diacylglycerol kinase (ATP)
MKTRLIVNPVSGRDEAPDLLPAINERLRTAFGDVGIVITVGEGDDEASARQAAEEGCRRIIVAGGDGTLNEALNGVAAAGALEATTFGVIPLGTGNDFASVLGLPDDAVGAAERIAAGQERRVDLGVLHERVFANASAGGFIAEVSDALTSGMKTVAGRLAYVIAGAGVLLDYEPFSMEGRFGDDVVPRRACQLFVVCNGQTIGGGHRVAPRARLDDGLLDVCLVEPAAAVEFLALLRRISNGEHLDDARVTYRQFREGELSFDRVVKVNTDGEVREAETCRYRVMPGAARFYS